MLSLLFTSLVSFFVSRFYELGLATLETKNAIRLGRTAFLCGEGGIRTHGTIASTRTFQARSFGHSDTSP